MNRNALLALYASIFLTALAACSTTGEQLESGEYPVIEITPELLRAQKPAVLPTPAPARAAASTAMLLGPGDVLRYRLDDGIATPAKASTQGDAPLKIRIEDSGQAIFPLVGALDAGGKTLAQVRDALTTKLKHYFKSPQFDLQIDEFVSARVTVTGAVATPGVLTIGHGPLTIAEALEKSGGVKPEADLSAVRILHAGGGEERLDIVPSSAAGALNQRVALAAGDTLLIEENHRNRVFLMGELLHTGAVYIRNGRLSLTEALNISEGKAGDAQGPNTLLVTLGNVYVIRNAVDHDGALTPTLSRPPGDAERDAIVVYKFDPTNPANYALADRFDLLPRDIVYVSAAPITEWHRFLVQLLPTNVGAFKTIN